MWTWSPVVTASTFSMKASVRIAITEIRRSSSSMAPGARTGIDRTRRSATAVRTPVRWSLPGEIFTVPSSVSSPS